VANLPWGEQDFTARRYWISGQDNFTETREPATGSGTFTIQREMNAPGVDLAIMEAKPRG
jgi:hypothetical protein